MSVFHTLSNCTEHQPAVCGVIGHVPQTTCFFKLVTVFMRLALSSYDNNIAELTIVT